MNIENWNDLYQFISTLTPCEREEPIRIIVDDGPIVMAKEACKAEGHYGRPSDEPNSYGYLLNDVELYGVDVSKWMRTMDKGDIFIHSY